MVATILSAFTALLGFLSSLFGWLNKQQQIEAGRSQERANSLEAEKEATDAAIRAREEAHAKWLSSTLAQRMSDDGFARD